MLKIFSCFVLGCFSAFLDLPACYMTSALTTSCSVMIARLYSLKQFDLSEGRQYIWRKKVLDFEKKFYRLSKTIFYLFKLYQKKEISQKKRSLRWKFYSPPFFIHIPVKTPEFYHEKKNTWKITSSIAKFNFTAAFSFRTSQRCQSSSQNYSIYFD